MATPSKEVLEQIARELLLDTDYLEEVLELISEDEILHARGYLLGYLDRSLSLKSFPEERAAQFYVWLGFSTEEASKMRQRSANGNYMRGQTRHN
jgi:hypothetical protein